MGLVQKLGARAAVRVGPFLISAVAVKNATDYHHRLRIEGGGPPLVMRVRPQRTYELADGVTVHVTSLRSCGQVVVVIDAPPEVPIERVERATASEAAA